MKIFFLCLLFFIGVFLEGTVIFFPVTFLLFFLLYILYGNTSWIFFFAFLAGIFLDVISFRTIGTSSIFLISFIFILTLYKRKFETKTVPFVLFSSFVVSLFYLTLFKYSYVLPQAAVSSLIAVILFKIFSRMERKRLLWRLELLFQIL